VNVISRRPLDGMGRNLGEAAMKGQTFFQENFS
jgi:hypothetical protein